MIWGKGYTDGVIGRYNMIESLYLYCASVGVYSLGSNVDSLNSSPLLSGIKCWFLPAGSIPTLMFQMPKNRQEVGGRNSLTNHLLQQCFLVSYFLLSCPLDSSTLPDSRLLSLDFGLPLCLPSFWPGVFLFLQQPDACLSSLLTLGLIWLLISLFVLLSIYLLLHQPLAHITISLSQQLAQTSWPHRNVQVVLVLSVLWLKTELTIKEALKKISLYIWKN